MHAKQWKTLTSTLAVALLVAACAQPEKPSATAIPVGSSLSQAVAALEGTSVVQKVNKQTREVTLKREDGSVMSVVAGPEVRNFDQIKVGDIVEAQTIELLAIAIEPATTQVRERREATVYGDTSSTPGAKPAATTRRTVEIIATVQHVDRKARVVVVEGAVQTVALKIGEGVDLSAIKVGDNVYVVYIESYSISVSAPPKKK
jgi:Cu/Ag efflux protein CusF